ncbi:bifunctional D-glycero-beta-D-manno-heptose-7-phosphate kinase/D-glycero-beta-D-manno-heptose 1-phosphate adenylyltransferase HldE [Haliea sp. AH-315-K21]|uniref:Bifunctional protein HldE n=1 Tax=SAR86 cluster bacterium TaxID=2030880 RepID=A0A2A5CIS8_9GAMM|nr:bifunctional D-glycero-beta-D-manno-heptose-7-phosphate kinase/D-glycero-beta-D-manno-heptose 1-phosphate adenylyltransferase HldE [Haliea sp. AH-315-K21]PCJ43428.1 MAG: bifunctional heptose 7-phosphate kinase/heptose 1-phosphate adenyltransferase [SAR86 cluster bacterium]
MKLNIPRFDTTRILVVGDVMLDRYWHGDTSRISPEAPVPVVKIDNIEESPGGAANVALNIAALGAACNLTGIIGNDAAGKSLQQALIAAGIECDFHLSDENPTITKLRVLSHHQQLIRLDFEEDFSNESSAHLNNKISALLKNVDLVIFSDYKKGSLNNIENFIALIKSADIPILVDPKGDDFSKYKGVTLLTPNLNEFETVVGKCATEEELVSKAQHLIKELDLEALLVTRGEHGMSLIRPGEAELHFPARSRDVFDVTGAGDTVISVLAASLGAGKPLPEAVALANIAAGIAVSKVGTVAVSGPELRREIQNDSDSGRGVMSREQLVQVVADAKANGEKVVFTNGCFDIIHAGHVGYLQDAREQGDRLIVALNDDASVTRLKGEGRPINPIERRMAVVAGLGAVDWVVSFDEDTPIPLLQEFEPDVLIKGGDYAINEVVGADIVQAYGGEIKVLTFLDNCSTTGIVEKIQKEKQ